MVKALSSAKYVVIIAVVCLLIAAVATFAWGALSTAQFLFALVSTAGQGSNLLGQLIELVDIFLIGTVLLIISFGLYELFVSKLDLPEWLVIDDLTKLKNKLTEIIVLILAIKFVRYFLESKNAQDTLLTALAVTAVASALIAFNYLRVREK
jgi:uncharacterized protein (TIGR00645 family)